MNIPKLLKRNLSLPLEFRLAVSDVTERIASEIAYARKLAIQSAIRREIAPKLAILRAESDLMDRLCSSGNVFGANRSRMQSRCAAIGHEYAIGNAELPTPYATELEKQTNESEKLAGNSWLAPVVFANEANGSTRH